MLPSRKPKGASNKKLTSRVTHCLLNCNQFQSLKSLLHKNFEKREGSKVARNCRVRESESATSRKKTALQKNFQLAIADGSFEQLQQLATNESWFEGLEVLEEVGSFSRHSIFSIAKYKILIPNNFRSTIANVGSEASNPLQIRKVFNSSLNISSLGKHEILVQKNFQEEIANASLKETQQLATNESWFAKLEVLEEVGSFSRHSIFSIAKYKVLVPNNFHSTIANVGSEVSNPLQIRKVFHSSLNISSLGEHESLVQKNFNLAMADEIFETQDPLPIIKHPDSPPDVLVQIDTKNLVLEQWRYDKLQAAIDDESLSEALEILEEIGICGDAAIATIRVMQMEGEIRSEFTFFQKWEQHQGKPIEPERRVEK